MIKKRLAFTGAGNISVWKKLMNIPYFPWSETWEHNHCEFCWATFSEFDGDLHKGYTTEDKRTWICPECYKDFKEIFEWELIESQ